MTYPTSGGSPDPYQPPQPYGQQQYDPNAPYPAEAAPSSGQPGYGQPPAPFGQPPGGHAQPPAAFGQPPAGYGQPPAAYGQPPAGYEQPAAYGEQPTSPYGGPPVPYGQPYGSPPPYGQYPYAPVATTNTMAILALVFAFVFAPAAIVMGHVARKQIRQTGEQGEGLATAGLWLGYIFTTIGVLFCIGYILIVVVAIGSAANSSGTY